MLFKVALESLKNRRSSVLLTIFALTISISLLLTVEHIRQQAKVSFTRTVSGVDLIVGPRTGSLNLLLFSVYHKGSVGSSMEYSTRALFSQNKNVEWTIPVSLGDTHRGFTVLGTTNDFFQHFQYGLNQPLQIVQGRAFAASNEAVLGATVAKKLGYRLLDGIVLSHGLGSVSFKQHTDFPFKVVGILAATGTPVDETVHIPLQGLAAAHGAKNHTQKSSFTKNIHADKHDHEDEHGHEHGHGEHHSSAEHQFSSIAPNPKYPLSQISATEPISAIHVGLTNPVAVLSLQQKINQNQEIPLSAILPGIVLNELWQLVSFIEHLLLGIAWLIVVSSCIGLATMLLASMRERTKEIAILRTLGAAPTRIFFLLQIEALGIVLTAILISLMSVTGMLFLLQNWLASTLGLYLTLNLFTLSTSLILLGILAVTCICTLIPAIRGYQDALTNRLQ
jgi:putative ABC transport system permease protein